MVRLSRGKRSRISIVRVAIGGFARGCCAGGALLLAASAPGCADPGAGGGADGGGGSAQADAGGGAGGSSGHGGTGGGPGTGGTPAVDGAAGTGGAPGTGGGSGTGGTVAPGAGMITVIATAAAGLNKPTDLEFNPYQAGELWVTNQGDDSMTIIGTASTEPMPERRRDGSHSHFMNLPAGIAFGGAETTIMDAQGVMVKGTFATCGESRNGGDDFMGPVLWASDLRIFAVAKAMRVPPFNSSRAGSLGSHIDMLHLSPLCTGIAWEGTGNIYWTYSGLTKAFIRYDFRQDHWIGNDNHTDGAEWRYTVPGQLGYVAGVPSHLSYRQSEQALYFADTANGRVVKFLPASTTGMTTMRNQDGLRTGPSLELSGGKLTEVVARGTLSKPSGLEIRGESMFVTDNASGKIHKFAVTGAPQASVQTDVKPGGLAGVTIGPDGKVYFVDMLGNRVLRLESGLGSAVP